MIVGQSIENGETKRRMKAQNYHVDVDKLKPAAGAISDSVNVVHTNMISLSI